MISPYEIIKSILRTEKLAVYEPQGKYVFLVDKSANKIEIKKAVEEIYKVKVKDVNVCILPGKIRRVRHQPGKTPDFKKAIVTLKEGHKIEVTA